MRINSHNLQVASQDPYAFCDGTLDSDPQPLIHYFANKDRKTYGESNHCRAYEKARRLQRLAERSRKARGRSA